MGFPRDTHVRFFFQVTQCRCYFSRDIYARYRFKSLPWCSTASPLKPIVKVCDNSVHVDLLSLFLLTVVIVVLDPTMYTVSEGGVVSFTIRRLTQTTKTVSVIFNTIPGSAIGVPPHHPSHSFPCTHHFT